MSEKFSFDGSGSQAFVSCGSVENTRGLCEMGERNQTCCLKLGKGLGFLAYKGRLGGRTLQPAGLQGFGLVRRSGSQEVSANIN